MAVRGITDRGGVRGEELELVVGAADAADTTGIIARLTRLMRLFRRLLRLPQ